MRRREVAGVEYVRCAAVVRLGCVWVCLEYYTVRVLPLPPPVPSTISSSFIRSIAEYVQWKPGTDSQISAHGVLR